MPTELSHGSELRSSRSPCRVTPRRIREWERCCAVATTLDAVVPGAAPEGRRSIWQARRRPGSGRRARRSWRDHGPNTLFARQGLFVPLGSTQSRKAGRRRGMASIVARGVMSAVRLTATVAVLCAPALFAHRPARATSPASSPTRRRRSRAPHRPNGVRLCSALPAQHREVLRRRPDRRDRRLPAACLRARTGPGR